MTDPHCRNLLTCDRCIKEVSSSGMTEVQTYAWFEDVNAMRCLQHIYHPIGSLWKHNQPGAFAQREQPLIHGDQEVWCIAAIAVTLDDGRNRFTYRLLMHNISLPCGKQEQIGLSAKQLQSCVTLAITCWYWVHRCWLDSVLDCCVSIQHLVAGNLTHSCMTQHCSVTFLLYVPECWSCKTPHHDTRRMFAAPMRCALTRHW